MRLRWWKIPAVLSIGALTTDEPWKALVVTAWLVVLALEEARP